MSKGNSNFKSKKSHSSKPYDVSKSFVGKVTSRVTELLSQRTWLNRWLSPAPDDVAGNSSHHPASSTVLNNAQINASTPGSDYGPGPSKRPRLPMDSPFVHNKFLSSVHGEEISPISRVIPNDTAVAGPSGLCQLNQKRSFSMSEGSPSISAAPQSSNTTAATDKINGDDCSETSESTSGCSSLVPQAQTSQNRRSESRHMSFAGSSGGGSSNALNRPLFPGRSSPKVDLSTLQRRRPKFDVTAFTSSRLPYTNPSLGKSSQQLSSPFYRGQTMYGGASAYNTSSGLFSTTPRRTGVTVRPVNVNSPSEPALSQTAKKILDALQEFSTPIVDAKRLPVIPGTKRKLERYSELNLPTTSELLRVKRRERLQMSVSAARQASLSSSQPPSPASMNSEPEYRIRDNGEDEKHVGKITRKCKESAEEEVSVKVSLPTAVLPIKTLPIFDIPVPPRPVPIVSSSSTSAVSTSSKITTVVPPIIAANKVVTNAGFLPEFNLSPPVLVSTDLRTSISNENIKFTFSEPFLEKSGKKKSLLCSVISDNDNSRINFSKKLLENDGKGCSNVKDSLGSVTKDCSTNSVGSKDVKSGTSSVDSGKKNACESSWKCSMCMVVNNKDKNKCVACDTPKAQPLTSVSEPIVFKVPPDTWECKECFIRNKNSLATCAACASPRVPKKPAAVTVPASTATTVAPTSTVNMKETTKSGFGDLFKPPSDTWECKECFVRNKNTSEKCVSCESIKPGSVPTVSDSKPQGFGNLFKKPEGSWECSSCLVRNNSKSVKCVACETPKPGAEPEKPNTTSPPASSGFKFGIASSGFSMPNSDTNKNSGSETTGGFVFGASKPSTTTSPKFTFGIPAVKSTEDSPKVKKKANDKIGSPLQELAKLQEKSNPQPFKFGINHDAEKPTNADKVIPNKITFGSNEPLKSTVDKAEIKEVNAFVFGSSVPTEKKTNSADSAPKASGGFTLQPKLEQTGKPFKNDNAEVKNPASEVFAFGGNSEVTSNVFSAPATKPNPFGSNPEVTSNVFSAPPTTKPNPLFMFGSATTTKAETKPVFGAPVDSLKDSTSVAKPVFGAANESASIFINHKSNAKPPVFGNSLVNEIKPIVSNSSNAVPTFGSTTTNNTDVIPGFNKPETQTSTASSFLAFGSSAPSPFQTSTQPQQDKPLFSVPNANTGGIQSNPAAQSNAFTFGSASTNTEQPKPAGFGFSVPSQTPNTGFSFSTPSTPAQNFNFTPKMNEPSQQAFNFNPVPSTPATPAPAFGMPTPAPSFGENSSTFSFGSQAANPQPQPAATPAPVFGFTGSQANPVPTPFMFGSSNAEPNQSVISTPTPSTPPSFNPNARPIINFTGGSIPSFTASPASVPANRRIKKAVRRSNQPRP